MSPLLTRLDAHDRALYARWRLAHDAPPSAARLLWTALTHAGGATASIAVALLPLTVGGPLAVAGWEPGLALLLSHLVVQVMKRNVLRCRPTEALRTSALCVVPDRFSFPSGHASAAMAVAFTFACSFPGQALPLLVLSSAVGFSRVRLGVHYPGDVIAGQAIALASGALVVALI